MREVLAIDIGGTTLKAARVAADGRVIAEAEASSSMESSLDQWLKRSIELLQRVMASHNPRGLAVACRGVIDPETTEVLRLPGRLGVLQGKRLSDLFRSIAPSERIVAENDAKAALVGEAWVGAARGKSDVVLLTLGTHVGGAVLSGGRILRGGHHAAGHLGHWTLDPNGPACHCGNRGCLTQYFSGHALAQRAEGLDARQVCARARAGDAHCRAIVTEGSRALGAALAGMAHAIDPETVVLTGRLTESADLFLDALEQELAGRTGGWLPAPPELRIGMLGQAAGCVGAARLWLEKFGAEAGTG